MPEDKNPYIVNVIKQSNVIECVRQIGNHYLICTPLKLKGLGVRICQNYELIHYKQYRIGWNSYRVTQLALEKLKKSYHVNMSEMSEPNRYQHSS